jgi:hypothetical protein
MPDAAGKTVSVQVPQEALTKSGIKAGDEVKIRVRRAGVTGVFAHPDGVEKK